MPRTKAATKTPEEQTPAPAKKLGRPTVRTPEVAQKIFADIEEFGLSLSKAAVAHGVSNQAASDWKRDDPEFAEGIARAEAEWIKKTITAIQGGARHWGSLTWLLSRRLRDEYGDRMDLNHTGITPTPTGAEDEYALRVVKKMMPWVYTVNKTGADAPPAPPPVGGQP